MKKVSIINYGLGNLFSIQNACSYVGINSIITNDEKIINKSDAIILPGVGSFEHAMSSLDKLKLIDSIISFAKSGRPLIGICLGMQLLFEKSYEFGSHDGLGLISGEVIKLLLTVFRIIAVVVMFVYVYFSYKKHNSSILFLFVFSLLISGAVGNSIDSVFYDFLANLKN